MLNFKWGCASYLFYSIRLNFSVNAPHERTIRVWRKTMVGDQRLVLNSENYRISSYCLAPMNPFRFVDVVQSSKNVATDVIRTSEFDQRVWQRKIGMRWVTEILTKSWIRWSRAPIRWWSILLQGSIKIACCEHYRYWRHGFVGAIGVKIWSCTHG
jgi:hypothetical protein